MARHSRTYSLLAPWLLAGASLGVLVLISQRNFLLFHSLVEFFSILVAFSIFIIAWNTRRLHENHFYFFLGIAYLFVGSLDLLHTLAYVGMGVFEAHGGNLSTQLWISARYLESISLLCAPLFFKRRLVKVPVVVLYAMVTGLLLGAIFWHIFPVCFVEGRGLTPFKIGSEYLICLLLLAAAWNLYGHRHQLAPPIFKMVLAALGLTILAELFFTFYVSVYGLSNILGHYCKFISFVLIYKALVQSSLKDPLRVLFNDLASSEERFRLLYQNTPLPYQSLDEQGHFVEVNATWLSTMGYNEDEVVGHSFGDFLEGEWQGHFKENFPKFKDAGEVLGVEFELRKKDGSFLPVRFHGKIGYDEQGNFKQTHCIFEDISRQQEAERALVASEERFRQIFNNAPYTISYLDTELRILELNPLMEQFVAGQKSEDVEGQHCYDVWGQYADDDTKKGREKICDVCQTQYVLKDGKTRTYARPVGDKYFQIIASPVMDGDGHIVGVLECGHDITERRQAEEALHESEEKYRRFFSTVSNGWVYHKVVTDEQNRPIDYIFLEVNEAYENLTGLKKENLIGKRVTEVLPGIADDPARWIERFGQVALTGESDSFENYADSLGRWYSVSATCPEKGYFIVVFDDITARKEAEEKLLHAMSELEEANKDLAQFNFVVVHDLKAPLRAMSNYTAFLDEDMGPDLGPESRHHLELLRQAALETSRLVEDLLYLAKISKQDLQLEAIDFGDFLDSLIRSMDIPADVEIVRADCIGVVESDPGLLRQIFQNLLDNAITYNTSSPRRVEVGCGPDDGGAIVCYVKDNGLGIAPEHHDYVFQLFKRLHTSREYPGTGAGLAIVKRALERLGATCKLMSSPGQGTTLSFTLPHDGDLKSVAKEVQP